MEKLQNAISVALICKPFFAFAVVSYMNSTSYVIGCVYGSNSDPQFKDNKIYLTDSLDKNDLCVCSGSLNSSAEYTISTAVLCVKHKLALSFLFKKSEEG